MDSKPLLYGLIGFFLGGLLVATAATTFDQPNSRNHAETSMNEMSISLEDKTGDNYDETFLAHMIVHHESAVDMAKLSATNAKHDEIKQLSATIARSQAEEIAQMKQWQKDWGYSATSNSNNHMSH